MDMTSSGMSLLSIYLVGGLIVVLLLLLAAFILNNRRASRIEGAMEEMQERLVQSEVALKDAEQSLDELFGRRRLEGGSSVSDLSSITYVDEEGNEHNLKETIEGMNRQIADIGAEQQRYYESIIKEQQVLVESVSSVKDLIGNIQSGSSHGDMGQSDTSMRASMNMDTQQPLRQQSYGNQNMYAQNEEQAYMAADEAFNQSSNGIFMPPDGTESQGGGDDDLVNDAAFAQTASDIARLVARTDFNSLDTSGAPATIGEHMNNARNEQGAQSRGQGRQGQGRGQGQNRGLNQGRKPQPGQPFYNGGRDPMNPLGINNNYSQNNAEMGSFAADQNMPYGSPQGQVYGSGQQVNPTPGLSSNSEFIQVEIDPQQRLSRQESVLEQPEADQQPEPAVGGRTSSGTAFIKAADDDSFIPVNHADALSAVDDSASAMSSGSADMGSGMDGGAGMGSADPGMGSADPGMGSGSQGSAGRDLGNISVDDLSMPDDMIIPDGMQAPPPPVHVPPPVDDLVLPDNGSADGMSGLSAEDMADLSDDQIGDIADATMDEVIAEATSTSKVNDGLEFASDDFEAPVPSPNLSANDSMSGNVLSGDEVQDMLHELDDLDLKAVAQSDNDGAASAGNAAAAASSADTSGADAQPRDPVANTIEEIMDIMGDDPAAAVVDELRMSSRPDLDEKSDLADKSDSSDLSDKNIRGRKNRKSDRGARSGKDSKPDKSDMAADQAADEADTAGGAAGAAAGADGKGGDESSSAAQSGAAARVIEEPAQVILSVQSGIAPEESSSGRRKNNRLKERERSTYKAESFEGSGRPDHSNGYQPDKDSSDFSSVAITEEGQALRSFASADQLKNGSYAQPDRNDGWTMESGDSSLISSKDIGGKEDQERLEALEKFTRRNSKVTPSEDISSDGDDGAVSFSSEQSVGEATGKTQLTIDYASSKSLDDIDDLRVAVNHDMSPADAAKAARAGRGSAGDSAGAAGGMTGDMSQANENYASSAESAPVVDMIYDHEFVQKQKEMGNTGIRLDTLDKAHEYIEAGVSLAEISANTGLSEDELRLIYEVDEDGRIKDTSAEFKRKAMEHEAEMQRQALLTPEEKAALELPVTEEELAAADSALAAAAASDRDSHTGRSGNAASGSAQNDSDSQAGSAKSRKGKKKNKKNASGKSRKRAALESPEPSSALDKDERQIIASMMQEKPDPFSPEVARQARLELNDLYAVAGNTTFTAGVELHDEVPEEIALADKLREAGARPGDMPELNVPDTMMSFGRSLDDISYLAAGDGIRAQSITLSDDEVISDKDLDAIDRLADSIISENEKKGLLTTSRQSQGETAAGSSVSYDEVEDPLNVLNDFKHKGASAAALALSVENTSQDYLRNLTADLDSALEDDSVTIGSSARAPAEPVIELSPEDKVKANREKISKLASGRDSNSHAARAAAVEDQRARARRNRAADQSSIGAIGSVTSESSIAESVMPVGNGSAWAAAAGAAAAAGRSIARGGAQGAAAMNGGGHGTPQDLAQLLGADTVDDEDLQMLTGARAGAAGAGIAGANRGGGRSASYPTVEQALARMDSPPSAGGALSIGAVERPLPATSAFSHATSMNPGMSDVVSMAPMALGTIEGGTSWSDDAAASADDDEDPAALLSQVVNGGLNSVSTLSKDQLDTLNELHNTGMAGGAAAASAAATAQPGSRSGGHYANYQARNAYGIKRR